MKSYPVACREITRRFGRDERRRSFQCGDTSGVTATISASRIPNMASSVWMVESALRNVTSAEASSSDSPWSASPARPWREAMTTRGRRDPRSTTWVSTGARCCGMACDL